MVISSVLSSQVHPWDRCPILAPLVLIPDAIIPYDPESKGLLADHLSASMVLDRILGPYSAVSFGTGSKFVQNMSKGKNKEIIKIN